MIEDIPENVNSGRHKVSYNIVDKKERSTDFNLREFQPVRERLYEVPPCVIDHTNCNLRSRSHAKQQYQKTFNS